MKIFYCLVSSLQYQVKGNVISSSLLSNAYLMTCETEETAAKTALEREKEHLEKECDRYDDIQVFTKEMNPYNLMKLLSGEPLRMVRQTFGNSDSESFEELEAEVIG